MSVLCSLWVLYETSLPVLFFVTDPVTSYKVPPAGEKGDCNEGVCCALTSISCHAFE